MTQRSNKYALKNNLIIQTGKILYNSYMFNITNEVWLNRLTDKCS